MNPFDELDGLHGSELHGLFSSIKKALSSAKKVVTSPIKKIENTINTKTIAPIVSKIVPSQYQAQATRVLGVNPIDRIKATSANAQQIRVTAENKLLPEKVVVEQRRLEADPVVQGAATAVAAVFAGPLVSSIIGTAAPAAITAKTVMLAAAKGAAQGLVEKKLTIKPSPNPSPIPLSTKAKSIATKEQLDLLNNSGVSQSEKNALINQLNQLAEITNASAAQSIASLMTQIKNDPAFASVLYQLQMQGKTNEQIIEIWKSSKNYQAVTTAAGSDAVYDYLYKQYLSQGYSPENASVLAKDSALKVGGTAAKNMSSNDLLVKFALILIPIGLAMFGG